MEKNKVKKLMFLTMIFGLMVVFSGSASAQDIILKAGVNNVDGSGKFKPLVGDRLNLGMTKQTTPNPDFGLKPGDRACSMRIAHGKGQSAYAFVYLDCSKAPNFSSTSNVSKVENPKNDDIFIGDKLDLNVTKKMITVTRGGRQTMKLYYK